MKLLLDTQIFIWWDSEPEKLPSGIRRLLQNNINVLMLSIASVWEIQIKLQLGKLLLHGPLEQIVYEQQAINKLELLPIQLAHVLTLQMLPFHHRDPFDRLLIAQAIHADVALVSVDSNVKKYPARVIDS